MTSPWNKNVNPADVPDKLFEKYLEISMETVKFNSTLTEGNIIASISTLGSALILCMKARGFNQKTMVKICESLLNRVKEFKD